MIPQLGKVDPSISQYFLNHRGKLNFVALDLIMAMSNIPFYNRKIKGSLAIATLKGIYLDLEKINEYPDKLLFFIILHEMAHYKRIKKLGKENVIKFLSDENFDKFFNHVIEEEIIADRYACLMYRLINKETFPREVTQQLHLPLNREKYKKVAIQLFGYIQNSEERYNQLLESYLV